MVLVGQSAVDHLPAFSKSPGADHFATKVDSADRLSSISLQHALPANLLLLRSSLSSTSPLTATRFPLALPLTQSEWAVWSRFGSSWLHSPLNFFFFIFIIIPVRSPFGTARPAWPASLYFIRSLSTSLAKSSFSFSLLLLLLVHPVRFVGSLRKGMSLLLSTFIRYSALSPAAADPLFFHSQSFSLQFHLCRCISILLTLTHVRVCVLIDLLIDFRPEFSSTLSHLHFDPDLFVCHTSFFMLSICFGVIFKSPFERRNYHQRRRTIQLSNTRPVRISNQKRKGFKLNCFFFRSTNLNIVRNNFFVFRVIWQSY